MAAPSGVDGGRSWENDGINYVYDVSEEQFADFQRALTEPGRGRGGGGGGGEAEGSDDDDGDGTPLTPEDLWSEKHILDAAQLALKDHETKTGQKLNLIGLVSGEYTIVSGDLYRLKLRVSDESGKPYLYETVVYTCPMYNRQGITGKCQIASLPPFFFPFTSPPPPPPPPRYHTKIWSCYRFAHQLFPEARGQKAARLV